MFKIGDLVTRNKYNNDCLFKIKDIKDGIYYLSGVDIRLYVSTTESDLRKENNRINYEDDININNERNEDYFYMTPTILHIDSDQDYLDRCLKLYKKNKLNAYGILIKEIEISNNIISYLNDIKPNIVVITGHDLYNKDKNTYQNSDNYSKAIIKAREYEESYDKLKIIAGACQSNFEELIKSGANFASSPKRINIHALDPAILASIIALTENTKEIDLISTLNKTKCGPNGIGGITCHGSMFVGYPK